MALFIHRLRVVRGIGAGGLFIFHLKGIDDTLKELFYIYLRYFLIHTLFYIYLILSFIFKIVAVTF